MAALPLVIVAVAAALFGPLSALGQKEPDCCAWRKVELIKVEVAVYPVPTPPGTLVWMDLGPTLPVDQDFIPPNSMGPDLTVHLFFDVSAGLVIEDEEEFSAGAVYTFVNPPLPGELATDWFLCTLNTLFGEVNDEQLRADFENNEISLELERTFHLDGHTWIDPLLGPYRFFRVSSNLLIRDHSGVTIRRLRRLCKRWQ